MHLNTKVAIDHFFGSIVIKMLMPFNRKRKSTVSSTTVRPKCFIVLKLLGMGSIVQATRLLAALKSHYPEARLIFLTKKGNEQLTNRISLIDQTLTIDDSSVWALAMSLSRIVKLFRGWTDTCIINLEVFSNLGSLIVLTSKACWKAAFFRGDGDLRLESAIDYLVYFNEAAPLSEVYLQIGRALGIGMVSPDLAELITTQEDVREVDDLIRSHGLAADSIPLVLVNPNVSELLPERGWFPDRFAQLIERLINAVPGLHVMLIGSPIEKDYVDDIMRLISPRYHSRVSNVAGKTHLGGLIELIKRAKLLITTDSGPMHFAFATGTPTVAFFGPVATEQRSCKTKAQTVFLYHQIYCSPCAHKFIEAPCKGNNICMQQISVEEAFETVSAVLSNKHALALTDEPMSYVCNGKPLGLIQRDSGS